MSLRLSLIRSHLAEVMAVLVLLMLSAQGDAQNPAVDGIREWSLTRTVPAIEATQAAVADRNYLYAINNIHVARYRREDGARIALSTGAARHLNSGFLWDNAIYCAHSNYPQIPEQSEIKRLNLATMALETFHEFGACDGSLTWAVRHRDHWWCFFAYYGDDNGRSYLAKLDADWNISARWNLPRSVLDQLGRYSLSGGIWWNDEILATGHDDPILFRLQLPAQGNTLDLLGVSRIPFTGQGFAIDPVTGGLIGINRPQRSILLTVPSSR